ncbi:MAG TPA: hypothetical protein PLP42_05110, partial [Acidobacteriota bacterium]|nr:hypothetical protein [Acidobacteriota bacterium]
PFAALAYAGLYLWERLDATEGSTKPKLRYLFLVGVLIGLDYLISARGVTLWAAASALLIIQKDWHRALALCAGFVIFTVPWVLWQIINSPPSDPAYWYYSKVSYQTWHVFCAHSFHEAAVIVLVNASSWFALPQLIWGFALNPRLVTATAWCLCVILFAISTWRLGQDTVISSRHGSPSLLGEEPENWPATLELMDWIKRETPKDGVIGSILDPIVYLYSDRKAIRPFQTRPFQLCYERGERTAPLGSVEEFRSHLLAHRISYLYLSPTLLFEERRHFFRLIAEISKAYPGIFRIAKQTADGRYMILQVELARLSSSQTSLGAPE